jgi:hypothetical protein
VSISGVLTTDLGALESGRGAFVQDATGGIAIYLDAVAPNVVRQIREGANVNVSAVFDGSRYAARQIDVPSASAPENH